MAIVFQPARLPAGESPNVQAYALDSAANFNKGAVVTLDAQGELAEHAGGTTVTGILGVSLAGCSAAGVADFGDEIPVAIADRNQVFMGQLINGTTIQTDLSGNVLGTQYGMVKNDGVWYVDEADTTNVVVEVIDKDDTLNVVFFKFLESTLQQP